MSSVEQTLDDVSHSSSGASLRAPLLFLIVEGDRPLARGARWSLDGVELVTIGRGPSRMATRSRDGKTLDVRVPGKWISSSHARIRAVGGQWLLEDAGSRNGVFVHGEKVTSHVVRETDVLEAGRIYFAVRGVPGAGGPVLRDEDAVRSTQPFGLRTLLPELDTSHAALARVARKSDVPILFLGPTGSGKEVLAREVHALSERGGPFIAVNCGALPATLVESLLFGHVKGAFSGAARDEVGFVRSADGGTLFLDEIGDLPASSQAALLRVLQEHEVIPVGATRPVKADVRVVAATHRALEALTETGGFRSDLLARLKGYTHRLPPLAERMPDFGVILSDVLTDVLARGPADRAGRITLMPDAARALLAYAWPLNIRELHQAMASAVALTTDDAIEARHLPAEVLAPPPPPSTRRGDGPAAQAAARSEDDALRDRLVGLLHENGGNVTAVARAMGKAPAQIHRWMNRFAIDPDTYRGA